MCVFLAGVVVVVCAYWGGCRWLVIAAWQRSDKRGAAIDKGSVRQLKTGHQGQSETATEGEGYPAAKTEKHWNPGMPQQQDGLKTPGQGKEGTSAPPPPHTHLD